MGVRFVIGKAGAGKTYHCLHAMRERLRESPVEGPRLIFLVPEQASQQMERAILLPADPAEPIIEASHRAEVFSFQRLAARLLESSSAAPAQTLSDSARVMVLRHLAAEHTAELRFYRRVQRQAGFLERLAASISELIQEGVAPQDLAAHPENASPNGNPRSAAKFHDLRILYEAYLRYLGGEFLDPSQSLQLARARIPQCEWLQGAEIWVDGFASLSGEESDTLLELARYARRVEIALLYDPSLIGSAGAPPTRRSLFDRTTRTFNELGEMFRGAGLTIDDPLLLNPSMPPRFKHNEDLSRIERSMFVLSTGSQSDSPPAPTSISLVELPTRRVEVEYAVSLISEWTRCDPPRYRYRDIAIIVRDLDPYYDLVRSALDDRAIACFIDRRRTMSHHPLVELMRVGARLPVEGLTLESARLLLKTGLLPLTSDAVDELENYLLAHGIDGWKLWAADWSYQKIGQQADSRPAPFPSEIAALERVNRARAAVVAAITPWLDFAVDPAGHSGLEWSEGFRSWLTHLGVFASSSQWAKQSQLQGDLDQAGEHMQTCTEVEKFLDSLAIAFGQRILDKEEFTEIVDAGLAGLSLGLVPPTVDQVLVGSIERTRHPDIKAAILLGFNEGIFPARIDEDSILNDEDREQLIHAGLRIGLPVRPRLQDESMLVYIALTRASHELVVTYARADEQNAKLHPSPFVKDLLAACPGLQKKVVSDPLLDRSLWDLHTAADLRRRLTSEFSSRLPLARDRGFSRAQWNQVYCQTRGELATDPIAALAFSSLGQPPSIAISADLIAQLIPPPLQASVTALESYATCPFKYFAEKTLRLTERVEAPLAEVDVGRVHHTIMEELAKDLMEHNRGFGQLGADELLASLRTSCERAADRLKTDGGLSSARDTYLLRRSASRLARIVHAQKRVDSSGAIRPRAAELAFGDPKELKGLPALKLRTPKGREVRLRGFIDRVDLVEAADELLGVVIDYKDTPQKKLDYGRAYHGLSLQLLAYLLVLAEQGTTLAGRPIRPAGALFTSLSPRYHMISHPDQPPSREMNLQGSYQSRGLFRDDLLPELGIESARSSWSPYHSIFHNREGKPGHIDSNDAVDKSQFESMLQHTRRRMGELADGILDGEMPIRPYRLGTFSPCSWCSMAAVCRFESGLCDVRYLETLKRSEIYVRLGGVGAGKQNNASETGEGEES